MWAPHVGLGCGAQQALRLVVEGGLQEGLVDVALLVCRVGPSGHPHHSAHAVGCLVGLDLLWQGEAHVQVAPCGLPDLPGDLETFLGDLDLEYLLGDLDTLRYLPLALCSTQFLAKCPLLPQLKHSSELLLRLSLLESLPPPPPLRLSPYIFRTIFSKS